MDSETALLTLDAVYYRTYTNHLAKDIGSAQSMFVSIYILVTYGYLYWSVAPLDHISLGDGLARPVPTKFF